MAVTFRELNAARTKANKLTKSADSAWRRARTPYGITKAEEKGRLAREARAEAYRLADEYEAQKRG
jgi:hypothetical protein